MNPLIVEQAFKTALNASAFQNTQIYTGNSYDELTPESLNLIVSANSFQAVGVGLYTVKITIKVVAPALLGADAYRDFSATLETLKSSLSNSYLSANWPSLSSPVFVGIYFETIDMSRDKNEWVAEISMTAGISD
jgi:hypothetical protein